MADPPNDTPEWAKAVGGAAGALINSTLDAIGRPALKQIYDATIGDHLTEWRARNLANVFRAYQEATKDLPPEGRRFVAEKVGVRFIEEASFEDDPDLQKIWVNMLAAAVSNHRPDITTRYVSTAKELVPVEVLLLREAYDQAKKLGPALQVILTMRITPLWPSKEAIIDIASHLISLGIFQRVEHRLIMGKDFSTSRVEMRHLTAIEDMDTLRFTKFGWEFVCAAIEGASPPP